MSDPASDRNPIRGLAPAARAVLDTNVVLDWLVFNDPGVALLQQAVRTGALVWLSCPAMRAEVAHMLAHASLSRWQHEPSVAMALHDRWACPLPDPGPLREPRPRCSDPDDQLFVDLAIESRARWLVSHDKALRKLARRLRPLGIEVVTPAQWVASFAAR